MSKELLWVNKNPHSCSLSQSSGSEARLIRSRVQSAAPGGGGKNKPSKQKLESRRKSNFSVRRHSHGHDPTCNGRLPFCTCSGSLRSNGLTRRRCDAPERPWAPWPGHSLDDSERRGLAFFAARTAAEMSGWQDGSFWSTAVFQASHDSKGIAHGLVSLSALHESSCTAYDGDHRARLRKMALHQWIKSLQAIGAETLSRSVALISVVLMTCLQNLYNSQQSHHLIRSGLKMLDDYDHLAFSTQEHVCESEHDMIQSVIRPLLLRLQARPCTLADPVLAFGVSVKVKMGQPLFHLSEPKIPLHFKSLHEARNSLESILDWGHDNLVEYCASPDPASKIKEPLQRLCEAWRHALEQQHRQQAATESKQSTKARRLLRAACIYGKILLETYGADDETIYDQYMSEFKELVLLLAQDCGKDNNTAKTMSFGIDDGVIQMLTFVGTKCRDPVIRRLALNSLMHNDRVEGDRIGPVAAMFVQKLIDAEEGQLLVTSCHDVPEHRRRRTYKGTKYRALRTRCLLLIGSPYDPARGARIDEVWMPLGDVSCSQVLDHTHPSENPISVYEPGRAAFFEDEKTSECYRIQLDTYFFPIPKA